MFGNLLNLATSVASATDAVVGTVTKPIEDVLDSVTEAIDGK